MADDFDDDVNDLDSRNDDVVNVEYWLYNDDDDVSDDFDDDVSDDFDDDVDKVDVNNVDDVDNVIDVDNADYVNDDVDDD